jgi:uncharacterized protein YecE (DUF72 family)
LKEYLIGTGGWAYYRIPGLPPLVAYSRAFNFVEVNTTFYQIPPLSEAEKWRKLVPPDFHFAVRAHRVITHTYKFQPTKQALDAFDKMGKICIALNAEILHLQTPPSLKMNGTSVVNLRNLLGSVNLGRLRLALEIRGTHASKLPAELVKAMQERDIVHCVDLSKGETPAYDSDLLYSRFFGKGKYNVYQPTDEELAEIDRKASNSRAERVVMSFHFVRMYKDAARLKIYKETAKFPQITGSTGMASLAETLSEDATFPAAKQELLDGQGWKLFDLTQTIRVHARDFLQRLPDRMYGNIDELVDALNSVAG